MDDYTLTELLSELQHHNPNEVKNINSKRFTDDVQLLDGYIFQINFIGCSFKSFSCSAGTRGFFFDNCDFERLSFITCEIKSLWLQNCETVKIFITSLGTKIDKLWVHDSNIIFLDIGTGSEINEIYLSTRNKEKLCLINNFDLNISSIKRLEISNYRSYHFTLRGQLNPENKFISTKFLCQSVTFEYFHNFSDFLINFYTPHSSSENFTIKHSSLGKSVLSNITFKNGNKLILTNSDISEIKYLSTTWPKKENIIISDETDSSDIFRQLKNISLNQKDKIQAFVFESYEMDEWKPDNLWDKIIKYSSKWTNYYGLKWHYSLFLMLFLGTFFMYMILNQDPSLKNDIWHHFGTFTFYPVHRTTDIFGTELENSTILIDSIWRFVSGFLLFQLISAFRKYFKK